MHLVALSLMASLLMTGCTVPGESWQRGQDSGAALDSGNFDTGSADLGSSDLGSSDLGSSDLGSSDLGSSDLGSSDLGSSDLGTSDAGPGEDLAPPPPAAVTWNDDVLPLLNGKCSPCHQQGPTAFLSDLSVLDNTPSGGFGCDTGAGMPACLLSVSETKVMPLGCSGDACMNGAGLELLGAWLEAGAPIDD
jgi:hypothetical protein